MSIRRVIDSLRFSLIDEDEDEGEHVRVMGGLTVTAGEG